MTEGTAAGEIGIGMLGYAFMGRAHAHAYRTLAHMMWPPPLRPRLEAIAGRDEAAVAQAALRFGFAGAVTDWRELVADERIALFDNAGPNHLHAEPTIAAAEAGKHVLCEKPLGRGADEAHATWKRVAAAGVVHMCAFNYRFVPAVRLARELLSTGDLGDVLHVRARYLQEWGVGSDAMSWRFDREQAGSGALGDLGAHLVDLVRYLTGQEVATASALTRTFTAEREGRPVDVDDAFEAAIELDGGAVGTLEASRCSLGRKNALTFEVDGTKGALAFDLERLNELRVHLPGSAPGASAQGFRNVLVTEADHPFMASWWPPGHVLGWEHTFVHELHHLLTAIRDDVGVGPHGATFADGYRCAEVCDAIARSAATGARVTVSYKG